MDDIVELCSLYPTGGELVGGHLSSVLAFMVQKTARVAFSRMSAVERGTLTLRLISVGGLQSDACRRLLFTELSPAYSTAALVRQSYEFYLNPVAQMTPLDDDDATTMKVRRNASSIPFQSLLRRNSNVKRYQPPVDFLGSDSIQILTALLCAWKSTDAARLSLEELPPGLATFLVLHSPLSTIRLLQSAVVLPSVPPTWRELWRRLIPSCTSSERETSRIHVLLTQEACSSFWPLASRLIVCPLAGSDVNGDEEDHDDGGSDEEKNHGATLEGPTTFLIHAMLRLWLMEIQEEWIRVGKGFLVESTDSLCRQALVCGMQWVEKDEVRLSGGNLGEELCGVVRAAYGLLLSVYHGQSMAAHYVRSALDHPEVTLFVPSFADLNEEEDVGQWSGGRDVVRCSSSAFVAALALRLPVSQLYIAEQVWQLLESKSTCRVGSAHEERMVELDGRVQVLLNSHVFSGVPINFTDKSIDSVSLSAATSSVPHGQEEIPFRRLRLKRPRLDEHENQPPEGGNHNVSNRVPVVPTPSEVSAVASQLCSAMVDFAMEELAQPLIVRRFSSSSSSDPTLAATSSDGGVSLGPTRLVLATPLHVKALMGLLAPPSSSSPLQSISGSVAVRDVCCVLMSVLLYRHCEALRDWLSHEESDEQRAAMTQRFTWRVRPWLRFFAPLGAYRYLPVSHVLLPECLRAMEEREGIAKGSGSVASESLKEFCSLIRSAF